MSASQPLTFGMLLKRYRRAAGLSQEQLGARAGYATAYVSALERDVRQPLPTTAAALVDALALDAPERAELLACVPRATRPKRQRPPAPPRRAEPHAALVGRQRELIRLGRHLAGEGPPLLLLAGEPGIGKSRLLYEAAARARDAGWSVLEGGCTRRGGQEPFAPLLVALARYLAARPPAMLRADLEGCSWLVRLLPELAERAVVPAPTWTLPPEQEYRLIVAAVERVLANLAGSAGTLLVLDDLQWAGQDALDLLAHLARAASDRPLRLLGAYRATEVGADHPLAVLLGDLGRDGLAEPLALGPLAPDEARALLTDLLAKAAGTEREPGASPDQEALTEQLLARGGGVPFFLVSCAGAAAQGEEDELPWTLQQSLRQRTIALPEPARALLGLAAVAGREVPRRPLLAAAREALGADRVALLAAVDAVRAAGLLAEDGRGDYRFAHDLIREVTLADLGAARRAAWHLAWAEVLEREPVGGRPERAAELAWHFARAEEPARALPYALAAGNRAEAAHAHAEAQRQYEIAAALAREVGDATREAEALERLGTVLTNLARHGAVDALDQALALHQVSGDVEGVARVLAQIGWAHDQRGTPREGITLLEAHMATLAAREVSPGNWARLQLVLAQLLDDTARFGEALHHATEASEFARAAEDARLLGQAQRMRGAVLITLGHLDEGVALVEEAIPLLEGSNDLHGVALALNHLAWLCDIRGDFARAAAYFDRALAVAEQSGSPNSIVLQLCNRGDIAFSMGEWARARDDFVRAADIASRLETSWVSPYPLAQLGLLDLAEGRWQTAILNLDQSIEMARRSANLEILRWAEGGLAERDLLEERPASGQARVERFLADLSEAGQDTEHVSLLLPLAAWAALESGEQAQAESLLSRCRGLANARGLRPALAATLRVSALLAVRQGRWQDGEAALDESLALCRAMPYPYAEAKALYVYGQLHAAQGEPERARERCEQALAILDRLGERLYAEHVERALGRRAQSE